MLTDKRFQLSISHISISPAYFSCNILSLCGSYSTPNTIDSREKISDRASRLFVYLELMDPGTTYVKKLGNHILQAMNPVCYTEPFVSMR